MVTYVNHMTTHSSGKNLFKIGRCKKVFDQAGNLNNCKVSHSGKKVTQVHAVQQMFVSFSHLRDAWITRFGYPPPPLEVFRKSIQIWLSKRHMIIHTGEKLHKCAHCSKSFAKAGHLKRHLLTHSQDKLYNCGKLFSLASNLKTHLLTHSGERPHKCMQCNYSFTLALSKHIMTHTRVKPHQCNQCGYSSITLANMRLHEMTHSGEKPHKCSQCDFSSIQKSHMTMHARSAHTGEKPFNCHQCTFSSASTGNLKSHKICHTEEKNFKCNDCNKSFKHQKNLTRHGLQQRLLLFVRLK